MTKRDIQNVIEIIMIECKRAPDCCFCPMCLACRADIPREWDIDGMTETVAGLLADDGLLDEYD